MPYSNNKIRRKRKYRLKPLPIFIAILLVIVATVLTVILINKDDKLPDLNNSSGSSLDSSQSAPSSNDVSGSEPISSDTPESEPTSSDTPESEPASSDTPESEPTSSDTPESEPTSSETPESEPTSSDVPESEPVTPTSQDDGVWNMILLNLDTPPLTKDMQVEKTKFDSQYVDSRTADSYTAMKSAAKADGIDLYLRSGYRSISTQRNNYNGNVARLEKTGLTNAEAIVETDKYYARPGTSEHHTGLAFDIITPQYHNDIHSLDDRFAETKAYTWLLKNCADYGFILRYPADKTAITKINFEPWHYRYVGVADAKAIMSSGVCLEEYLA